MALTQRIFHNFAEGFIVACESLFSPKKMGDMKAAFEKNAFKDILDVFLLPW